MFVQSNTVSSVKAYLKERLSPKFSENELKHIARELVMKHLNLSVAEYMLSDDYRLSESDLLFFRSCVKRLLADEPFQHILGKTEFYGLTLKTDKRALIPRPETEELVDWIVGGFQGETSLKLLDLCTGTGCIALALKSALHASTDITAVDWSDDALQLARENMLLTGQSIQLKKLNVLDEQGFNDFEEHSFDCWVSNPPYIPEQDQAAMDSNVRDFEPEMALFVADDQPLVFYQVIVNQAKRYLKKGGSLFFEIHEEMGTAVCGLLFQSGFKDVELRKDLQGKDRMVYGMLG